MHVVFFVRNEKGHTKQFIIFSLQEGLVDCLLICAYWIHTISRILFTNRVFCLDVCLLEYFTYCFQNISYCHFILIVLCCNKYNNQCFLLNSDNCKTSIANFHRSCPNPACSYDICPDCCSELRNGLQPGGREIPSTWAAKNDGNIPCPPKELGGCGTKNLVLRRILGANWVERLIGRVANYTSNYQLPDIDFSQNCLACLTDIHEVRRAAFRENSQDNFLYCPYATDLVEAGYGHFQIHWKRGEPVIVRNVLAMASGLSWEPMVMMRAFSYANRKLKQDTYSVKAIDCLDWHEVIANSINSVCYCRHSLKA